MTLLNLGASDTALRQAVADGTRLPFADNAFHVVFSNSVIEHMSDHAAFAEEIKRVGRRYFVQTPNRAFPLEPHVMMPLVNYLPKRWQRRPYRNFTLRGWLARPDQSYVDWFVEHPNLLGRREMQRLFPGARLASGRSLVAMR
ncbi:MAG TPA: methyltransferase domain-containing protein [Clostridia bacterium]|nr:methyltransferase domain-containing protein [Clostridia bacterium]